MRIRFTPFHDGESWPNILGGRSAVFGAASFGPLALVAFLESCTGLSGLRPSRAIRIAKWLPALRQQDAFFSASLQQDPVGTARVLLRWRDELSLQGWTGQVRVGRLADLARVDHPVANGIGDRLRAIRGRLPAMDPGIRDIELTERTADLCLEWKLTLDALRTQGTSIRELPLNLLNRQADYRLIRPYGPRIGADETAAWLAAQTSLKGTVIINADCVLDAALHRHGLPTTGAVEPGPGHGFQLVALIAATTFWPADPRQVQELLTLRPSILPISLSNALLRALTQAPGIGNETWESALRVGIEELDDDHDPKTVRALAEALFPNPSPSSKPITEVSAEDLRLRLDILGTWLQQETSLTSMQAGSIHHHIGELRAVLHHNNEGSWDRLRLSRWLAELGALASRDPAHCAATGLAAVRTPGAILAPVSRVLWWNFVRSPLDRDADIPWTEAERAGLDQAGISWPRVSAKARRRASQWARPLAFASELILVTPQFGEDGEECYPHQLWDELEEAGDPHLVVALHVRELLALPVASQRFKFASRDLTQREIESPSSLETLISCPMSYLLRYHAKALAGRLQILPGGRQLYGTLAHALFARLLVSNATSKDVAAAFHDLAPHLAASFYQPGGHLDLRRYAQDLQLAFDALQELLAKNAATVTACEQRYLVTDETYPGKQLSGRLDLELGPQPMVIDLKSGRASHLVAAIEQGRALQLALYARLLRGDHPDSDAAWPKVAYYLIGERRILSGETVLGADPIHGADPAKTYEAGASAARAAWLDLSKSHSAAAPGIDENGKKYAPRAWPQGIDAQGKLFIEPPCKFCDHAGLCGRGLETAQ